MVIKNFLSNRKSYFTILIMAILAISLGIDLYWILPNLPIQAMIPVVSLIGLLWWFGGLLLIMSICCGIVEWIWYLTK